MSQITKKWIADNAVDSNKLDKSDTYDFNQANGNLLVKTPDELSDNKQVVNKEYIDGIVENIENNFIVYQTDNLTYTDLINKTIKLSYVPNNFNNVELDAVNGGNLLYGTDFTISIKDDEAYLCLSSTSSIEGGFDVENLPTIGLDNIIIENEKFICNYFYTSVTGSPIGGNPSNPSNVNFTSSLFSYASLTNNILTISNVLTYLAPTIIDATGKQIIPDEITFEVVESSIVCHIDLSSYENFVGNWRITFLSN